MSLEERTYTMLAVSAAERFNTALPGLLPGQGFCRITFAGGVSAGKRLLAERPFDFLLVNSPLPDGPGVGLAIDACQRGGTVALLLVQAELHQDTYRHVVGHGVFTLPRPISKQALAQALLWMASARERLRRSEGQTISTQEKMAEIRLVNRAKWLLIQQRGMDEPQAHRYIEKRAMDLCLTRRQVAESLLQEAARR